MTVNELIEYLKENFKGEEKVWIDTKETNNLDDDLKLLQKVFSDNEGECVLEFCIYDEEKSWTFNV